MLIISSRVRVPQVYNGLMSRLRVFCTLISPVHRYLTWILIKYSFVIFDAIRFRFQIALTFGRGFTADVYGHERAREKFARVILTSYDEFV